MNILPFLSKALPVGLAVKGLSAANPKLQSFLGGAAAADYGIDQALDFLRDVYGGQEAPLKKASKGSRPEERAVLSRAGESIPAKLARGAAKVGGSLLGGKFASEFGEKAKSKALTPEVLPAEVKKTSPKGLGYERKEIGFSPRTKEPEHRFPKPKTPPPSPIPSDLEEKIRFHMDKSGLSVEDAVEVTEALNPSHRKAIKDLKKKGAFESLRGAENTVAPSSTSQAPASGEDEILRLIEELSRKLNG